MDLLYITNEAYMPHIAATIVSVFENNRDLHFDVHILGTDLKNESIKKLQNFVEKYNNTLQTIIVHPQELEIDLSVCGKWGIYPSLKLYTADFFPQIDYMLYMDADMICIGSLKPIESVNMSNSYIAMVTDEEGATAHKARLGMSSTAFYGCAGLVYFNLQKWRKDNLRQKCFNYFNAPENREILRYAEQDVLNKVCEGHITELPLRYNMFSYYWLHHGRNIPQKYRSTIEEQRKGAAIIHYIDACKPWFKDCRFPLKKYYHQYAALTPWGDQNWGFSPMYKGPLDSFKISLKSFLHRVGFLNYDFVYNI